MTLFTPQRVLRVWPLLFGLVVSSSPGLSRIYAAETYRFSHLAGSVTGPGSADGPAVAARFSRPSGTAVDSHGNIFVADQANNSIRKISPTGEVSTFAGHAGFYGGSDGIGTAARFYSPTAVAVDRNDWLYVSEAGGNTVRKISPEGIVTTLAGTWGYSGSTDGAGSAARFLAPGPIAVDRNLNVYVGDTSCVRKISPDGQVTTLAGTGGVVGYIDGPGSGARFWNITGLTVDGNGNLYVADGFTYTIRRVSPAGDVTTFVGIAGEQGLMDGTGGAIRLWLPRGLVFDGTGNLIVADEGSIRRITPAGAVTTITGNMPGGVRVFGFADGGPGVAQFASASGISIGADQNLYVADSANEAIRKINPATGAVSTVAGGPASSGSVDGIAAMARFQSPQGIAVDDAGVTYVADTNNHTIRKIAIDGTVTTLAGKAPAFGNADGVGDSARFFEPLGVAVDAKGNVFVADRSNNTIRKITPERQVTTFAGAAGLAGFTDGIGNQARFDGPNSVTVDSSGTLYVGMRGGVRRISADGDVSTIMRSNSINVSGVAVDAQGRVYFSDGSNNVVGWIASDGTPRILAGSYQQPGHLDGVGPGARFMAPYGLASDVQGNLFVAEWGSSTLRKVTPQGVVTTIGGDFFKFGTEDDVGSAASFNHPMAVAVDRRGTLYVADFNSNTIRKGWRVDQNTSVVNIATRAYCATGNGLTIGGFVIDGEGSKRVLIRAVGPSLTTQGISKADILADPTIEVHQGVPVIAQNDNWNDNLNAAEILSVANQVGAASLASDDTKSSALLLTLAPGAYTFLVKGKNNSSGVVLLEVYDADPGNLAAKFVNIATRAQANPGDRVAIGGFVIAGSTAKQVLLRAVGATLSSVGLDPNEVLADPVLELHRGSPVIAKIDDWGETGNSGNILGTSRRIGASPFAGGDAKSSALLITLNPGAYTFIASGKATSSGIVLVEVYDAD